MRCLPEKFNFASFCLGLAPRLALEYSRKFNRDSCHIRLQEPPLAFRRQSHAEISVGERHEHFEDNFIGCLFRFCVNTIVRFEPHTMLQFGAVKN